MVDRKENYKFDLKLQVLQMDLLRFRPIVSSKVTPISS